MTETLSSAALRSFQAYLFAEDLPGAEASLFGAGRPFADFGSISADFWMFPVDSLKAREPGSPALRVFLERGFSPRGGADQAIWLSRSRQALDAVLESPWGPDLPDFLPWRVFALLGPAAIFSWAAGLPDSAAALNRLDCEGRDLVESALASPRGDPSLHMPGELSLRLAHALGYSFSGIGKGSSSVHPLYSLIRAYRHDLVPIALELGADPDQPIVMADPAAGSGLLGQSAPVADLFEAMLPQPWLPGPIRESVLSSIAICRSASEARAIAKAAPESPSRSRLSGL